MPQFVDAAGPRVAFFVVEAVERVHLVLVQFGDQVVDRGQDGREVNGERTTSLRPSGYMTPMGPYLASSRFLV